MHHMCFKRQHGRQMPFAQGASALRARSKRMAKWPTSRPSPRKEGSARKAELTDSTNQLATPLMSRSLIGRPPREIWPSARKYFSTPFLLSQPPRYLFTSKSRKLENYSTPAPLIPSLTFDSLSLKDFPYQISKGWSGSLYSTAQQPIKVSLYNPLP